MISSPASDNNKQRHKYAYYVGQNMLLLGFKKHLLNFTKSLKHAAGWWAL